MKNFLIYFFSILLLNLNATAELQDCSQYKKLSKDYLKCTKDNLKFKSEDTTISEKVKDFSESKTLADFFFKKKDK